MTKATAAHLKAINEWLFNSSAEIMEKHGEVSPAVMCIDVKGDADFDNIRVISAAPMLASEVGKEMLAAFIDKLLASRASDVVAYVSEAWMLPLLKGEEHPTGSLEHVPGRIECLMVVLRTPEGDQTMHSHPIIRDPKPRLQREVRGEPIIALTGRFANKVDLQ